MTTHIGTLCFILIIALIIIPIEVIMTIIVIITAESQSSHTLPLLLVSAAKAKAFKHIKAYQCRHQLLVHAPLEELVPFCMRPNVVRGSDLASSLLPAAVPSSNDRNR